MQPLYVALVWHMHQPYYRDLRDGGIPMPWVRLHAAKDYLHMGEVLARHPGVHLTINLVPSLVEQMLDWAEGREIDDLARIAEQATWSDADKRFILNLCFSVNWDNIIRRHPRYAELLDRRPAALADPTAFSDADYRDLVTWFNLAWIDPGWLERDPLLAALVRKQRGYTVEDIRTVHGKQREMAAAVLPLYRRLARAGQLEVICSPYFHPILPLLADTGAARRPSPGLPVPAPPYRAAQDAAAQLALAVEAHTNQFGAPPSGLWPSEGAVSPEILPLVRAAGFTWLASDEVILARSLGRTLERDAGNLIVDPRALYQPYRVLAGAELGPFIIFRDHELSDRIGFLYQHLPGAQAAEDMTYRLLEIRRRLNDSDSAYLVSIILDGENCWEHYEHNGDVFLDAFYAELERRGELSAVTVNEFIQGRRPAATLARLATGSWILGDLTTWIGDPEHNRAWDELRQARDYLLRRTAQVATQGAEVAEDVAASTERVESPILSSAARPAPLGPLWQTRIDLAWRALHAAEGSDWFWWYSHRNSSDQDTLFDRLFRHALAAVYGAMGDEAPAWLAEPIYQAVQVTDYRPARGYVAPVLTGAPFPGEAWAAAASLMPAGASTGAMQRASGLLERCFVGHDPTRLYLRVDLRQPLDHYGMLIYLGGAPGAHTHQRVDADFYDHDLAPRDLAASWLVRRDAAQPSPFLYAAGAGGAWSAAGPVSAALGEKVLEIEIPLASLGFDLGEALKVYVALVSDQHVVASLPERKVAVIPLVAF